MDPVKDFEIPQAILDLITTARAESYIITAATALWAYDVVMAFPGELELLNRGATVSDIVYWITRLALAGFVVSMVSLVPIIAQLTPENDCQKIVPTAEWFMVLSMILNSLLFVFRVRAVYLNSKKVTIIFGIWWLTTLSQLLPPIANALNLFEGTENNCNAILEMKPWVVTGWISTAVFDTAVFVAISMQVLGFTGGIHTWKERMVSFLNGNELGKITRAVLQTGQLYYLITIIVDCLAISGLVGPTSFTETTRAAFALIGVVLQNITACAVFRLVKLRSRRPENSFIPTSQELATMRFIRVPRGQRSQMGRTTATTSTMMS
ncbi:hypothetical protein QCA50_003986 [Cerrena zonata]|uniref:Uncharacterized protein n=1 Tax=Cerrena zonata TaxID=2478898 RepID=A0AAW0GG14_9APHY